MAQEKLEIDDLQQCTSCEGYFTEDKIENDGQDDFCKTCYDGIGEEMKQTGIDSLDEYLESRKLTADFRLFYAAKWSGVTEEEYKELNG